MNGTTPTPIAMWGYSPIGTQGTVKIAQYLPVLQPVSGGGYLAQVHFQALSGTAGHSSSINFVDLPGATPPFTRGLWDNSAIAITGVTWTNSSVSVVSGTVLPPTIAASNVSITGTAQVGSVLTAVLTPADATATYQWQKSATASGTYAPISGATASTYTPVAGDATIYIQVVATGTGSYSGTVISAATGAVAAATYSIDIAAIPGVTAPVGGAIPVTAITPTSEYIGTVTWSPADSTFKSNTVYTATITLTPKTGYTLTGVTANFFTVAAATSVTNSANSGVITAVFPATGAAISLGTGWNLVSLPLVPTSVTISGGTPIVIEYYNTWVSPAGWKATTASGMVDGQAYWVAMSAPGTLTVTGTVAPVAPNPPSSYDVVVGWNMIGYTSTTSEAASVYLAGVSGIVRLYSYNNVTGYSSVTTTGTGSAAAMNPGQGYWLAVTAAGTIYP
jgi:hypothetical protein